jgi:translation initiation factor 1A
LREFQDQKADIILKYDGDEARSLKTFGELPESVQVRCGLASHRGGFEQCRRAEGDLMTGCGWTRITHAWCGVVVRIV